MARQLPTSQTDGRFEAVWQRNLLKNAASSDIAASLSRLYSERARHYHTMDHIDFCLSVFDQVSSLTSNPDAVELAIWFHDAIYNFPIQDNERLSAEFFMQASQDSLSTALREKVYKMVMATVHDVVPTDPDEQMMVDIDLSSFGRPWEQFARDGENVRRELAYLSDADFYPRQINFMTGLVSRDNFYNLAWFREKYEAQARSNVSRYLQILHDKGYERAHR